ncbi:MAG: TolC family protein [Candidatus Omnitrophica bacterium]|nr:TolC family protein [Candidatus Omnitrophota bacterium]
MKFFHFISIVGLFTFAAPAFAQETVLTLQEAIALALRDNPNILLQTEDINKSKEKIKESQAALWPTLNIVAGESVVKHFYPNDLTQTTAQLSAKQYLYKAGKTLNAIEQNEYQMRVTESLLDKTRLETALAVKKSFYTLLLAQEFAQLNKEILDNTQNHLDSFEMRFEKGLVSELDILKLKESLESVRYVYQDSYLQVESAQDLLKNLLHVDESVTIKPEAEFIYEPKEMAIEEGFLEAMKNRPEIKQYEAQEMANQKAIEVAKAENRPSVFASWDYYNRPVVSGVATQETWDYHTFGINVSWPFFDGWATKAKINQAISDLNRTKILREKLTKDIRLELKTSHLSLKNAIAEVKKYEASHKLYRNNLVSMQSKASKGLASSLDEEDAMLSYRVALFSKNQAIYNYIIAKSDFDKATGGF